MATPARAQEMVAAVSVTAAHRAGSRESVVSDPRPLTPNPRFLKIAVLAAVFACCAAAGSFDFRLRDTQGAMHTAAEWASAKAAVVYFTTTDCPIANSYVPEMNRIHDAYAPRGVAFYAVQTDLTIAEKDVVQYAKDYAYAYPLLLDPQQTLVRHAGATITPQVAIFAPDGKLLYLGRIDDRVADFGKQRLKATEFDLRDALDAVLAGKPVAHATTKSIGCAITLRTAAQ